MALEKITEAQMDANGVIAAPDILNGSAAANKAIFDRMVRRVVAPAYNACVDAVNELEQTKEETEAAVQKIEGLEAEAETLEATEEATVEVTLDEESGGLRVAFGIPRGERGLDGQPGKNGLSYLPVIEGNNVPDGVEAWIDPSIESYQGGGGGDGKQEVYVGPNEPTNGEAIWINPDEEEGSFLTKEETEALVDGKIAAIPEGMQMELLWENASPTSAFGAQTVSLDLSSYNHVAISARYGTSIENLLPLKTFEVGVVAVMNELANRNGLVTGVVTSMSRVLITSSTGVAFENGRSVGQMTDQMTDNNSCFIPVRIYGIKGVQ